MSRCASLTCAVCPVLKEMDSKDFFVAAFVSPHNLTSRLMCSTRFNLTLSFIVCCISLNNCSSTMYRTGSGLLASLRASSFALACFSSMRLFISSTDNSPSSPSASLLSCTWFSITNLVAMARFVSSVSSSTILGFFLTRPSSKGAHEKAMSRLPATDIRHRLGCSCAISTNCKRCSFFKLLFVTVRRNNFGHSWHISIKT
mmetsp:Transcript_136668/g.237290  ORF Transcript_136668/g.237290 Transcript_136668/m.237290 type:complete len:201 (-) Transcript_136668:420-1022(-)